MSKAVVYGIGIGVGVVILLAIGLLSTSLKRLNSDEVALKYDQFNKKLKDEPYYEGLHTGPPGYEFIKFDSVFRTMTFNDVDCLNIDGVSIDLSIGFQYRVRPRALFEVTTQFKDQDGYKQILLFIGVSAVHDVCSKYNTSEFQSARGKFQDELTQRLADKFEPISCDITDLQVNNIRRPNEYETAIKQKESAREDIEVAMEERPRLLTEAETKKRESETQAAIIVDKAYSDARILLNQAEAEAAAITNDYYKEAETYKALISSSGLNLNTEGFLAYLGVRTLAAARHSVQVGMAAPAKASYTDRLVPTL